MRKKRQTRLLLEVPLAGILDLLQQAFDIRLVGVEAGNARS
jgi:hypothetical protein